MPIVRSLGGKRQDGPFEGSLPVFMARRYFVAFIHHYLCCINSDNILQHNLFITLSCFEVIADLIRHLGLRWTEANHTYSKAGYVYTPAELMEHFVKTVLPLAVTNKVLNEPPLEIPGLLTQLVKVTLGIKADDCIALDTSETKEDEYFRIAAMRNREKLEDSECGDELQELQQVLGLVDRLCQNSQQGKSLELICFLSKQIRKQKKCFVF